MNASRTITTLAGETRLDELVVEEPLEIRLSHGPLARRMRSRLTVTLRTPGHDSELAMGLLVSEGVINSRGEVVAIEAEPNVLRVELAPEVLVDDARLNRIIMATSSCGLCGKTMLDAIEAECEPIVSTRTVSSSLLRGLPDRLRESQPTFSRTGGLHAAALFDGSGKLVSVREDVGRHNAVDKVLGAELAAGRAVNDYVLLVSGRAGFELVQKAARFGVPIMAAVGAPTTLAVELAERVGLTLIGFLRDGRGNIYAHQQRILAEPRT